MGMSVSPPPAASFVVSVHSFFYYLNAAAVLYYLASQACNYNQQTRAVFTEKGLLQCVARGFLNSFN